jgi:hypothetical protein
MVGLLARAAFTVNLGDLHCIIDNLSLTNSIGDASWLLPHHLSLETPGWHMDMAFG